MTEMLFTPNAAGAAAVPGVPVAFRGKLFPADKAKQQTKNQHAVSGMDGDGDLLVLVSDELKDPTKVQVLKRDGDGFAAAGMVKLSDAEDEVDLEAVGFDRPNDTAYVTGSHAVTRKVKDGVVEGVSLDEDERTARAQFFRFKLNPDGTHGPVEGPKSLARALKKHPVLGGFRDIASKENGIDIEALAIKGGRLHFGFRGPVLRGAWVPVLSCTWADPVGTAAVRYVRLGGRGIRDLAAVDDGFLVLAGPVGDGDITYRLYFWDGADHLSPGEDGPNPELLGEFSNLGAGKPEGLAVLGTSGRTYDVLLVCDGLPNGGPTRWSVTRRESASGRG